MRMKGKRASKAFGIILILALMLLQMTVGVFAEDAPGEPSADQGAEPPKSEWNQGTYDYTPGQSKWQTPYKELGTTTEGISVARDVETCKITYTIPSGFSGKQITFNVAGDIAKIMGSMGTPVPGYNERFTVEVKNESGDSYGYLENSFTAYPEDITPYIGNEINGTYSYKDGVKTEGIIEGAKGFSGSPIYYTYGINRTSNAAIKALLNITKGNPQTAEMEDSNIANKLQDLGYENGIQDLSRYYIDFYNKANNLSITKIEDFSDSILAKIFNGNRYDIRETCVEVAETGYNWFYNRLLSIIPDSKSEAPEYTLGSYVRSNEVYEFYCKQEFSEILSGAKGTLQPFNVNINGNYTNNAYMGFDFSFYLGFKLNKIEKTGTVNVTKKVTENGAAKNVSETYYAGVFKDDQLKEPVQVDGKDVIIPINLDNSSEGKSSDVTLPEGKYYITEVDKDGKPVDLNGNPKVTIAVNNQSTNELSISEGSATTVTITNAYTKQIDPPPIVPPQETPDGTFSAVKHVTLNGEAKKVTDTYYVGLFTDAFFTRAATNASGQKIIVPINLQDSSTGTTSNIKVPSGSYFATEVDKDGNPIQSSSELNVAVKVDGTQTNLMTVSSYKSPVVDITNAYTEVVDPYIEGQFSVTKHVTLNGDDFGMKDTFYLGVFDDKEFTKLTSSSDSEKLIVPIALDGDYQATVEDINIPLGTFYVTEVDKDGNPVTSSDGLKIKVTVDGKETSEMTIVQDGTKPHVEITNAYTDDGPQYYWTGTININKQVLQHGKAHKMEQARYYAGVFTDKNLTTLLTDDNDEDVIVPLDLENSSKTSVSIDVPVGAEGSATTYYVAEVTKDGSVITKDSKMAFTPTIKGGKVTVSGTKEGNVSIENNYAKKAPAIDNTSDDPTGNAVKTGDDSNILPVMVLATLAALVAVAAVLKKKKPIEEK